MVDFTKQIDDYYEREIEAIRRLDRGELNAAMNCLLDHYESESAVYVFGNGGSSATASHMVCDFNKGVSLNLRKKFRFACLNDNVPSLMAVANDLSFEDVFFSQLDGRLRKEDLVLAISGSGNSRNVVKAVEYARGIGSQVIGMTGYDGGRLARLSDFQLHVPADDMQIAEDLHMAFDHMIMQILWRYLEEKEGRAPVYKINK